MKTNAKLHRIQIPPCRPYEINAAQSWLSDMSAAGLHPEQDFLFAGLAFFERGEKRRYRYRFDIAKPATMFDDGGVDEEQQLICAAAGWDLVGIWGDFAVYRSPEDAAADIPELHTDPALHAAAYKKVRRRALGSLIWIVILAIVWVKMMFGGDALLDAVLGVGLGSRILSAVMILWALYLGLEHVFSLQIFCRRLCRAARGEPVSPSEQEEVRTEQNWHSRAWHRRLAFIASFFLIGAWLLSGFTAFLRAADDKNTVGLPGNEDRLPFALMQDFYDDSTFTYAALDWTNEIRQRWDWFIPVHLQVLQNGTITNPDGTSASGGLTVRYIETVSEQLTALLCRQYRYADEHDKYFGGYRTLARETLDSMSAVQGNLEVYTYTARFPTVLIRRDKTLLYINYYGDAFSSPDTVVRAMLAALADIQP